MERLAENRCINQQGDKGLAWLWYLYAEEKMLPVCAHALSVVAGRSLTTGGSGAQARKLLLRRSNHLNNCLRLECSLHKPSRRRNNAGQPSYIQSATVSPATAINERNNIGC